jgi:hypothetical protein
MTRIKFALCAISLCGAAIFTRLAWTQDSPVEEPIPVIRQSKSATAEGFEPRYINEVIYEPIPEQEALDAKRLQEAMHILKTSDDEAARKRAIEAIQEQLAKQFERDLTQREKELAAVEERVKSLRQQLDKRKAAKDDIIGLRLKTIINNAEGLGFPGEGGSSESTSLAPSSPAGAPPGLGVNFVPNSFEATPPTATSKPKSSR